MNQTLPKYEALSAPENQFTISARLSGSFVLVLLLFQHIAPLAQLRWLYLAAIGLCWFKLVELLTARRLPPIVGPVTKPFVIWLICIISIAWSISPEVTGYRSALLGLYVFYATLAIHAFSAGGTWWMVRFAQATVIYSVGITWWLIVMYGTARATGPVDKEILGSISNSLAAMNVLALPFLVAMKEIRGRWAPGQLLLISGCAFVIAISQSRAGYILFALSLLGSMVVISRNTLQLVRRILMGLALAATFGAIGILTGLDSYVTDTLQRAERTQLWEQLSDGRAQQGQSEYRRAAMYLSGVDVIQNKPMLGIGYHALPQYMEELGLPPIVSHNLMITFWSELGILGLATLVWLVFMTYSGLISGRKRARHRMEFAVYSVGLVAWTGALAHGLVRPQLTNPHFWLLIALGAVAASQRAASRPATSRDRAAPPKGGACAGLQK